jgi:hypothetical protein
MKIGLVRLPIERRTRVLPRDLRRAAVVFGVRLPRALTAAFIDQALKASERVAGLQV